MQFFKGRSLKHSLLMILLLVGVMIALLGLQGLTLAQESSPMHPVFKLLDTEGVNVLESGNPISTMMTCGSCHDTGFIQEHSFHSDAGLSTFTEPGTVAGGLVWDTSNGLFGKWNPVLYRYLSPAGDEIIDLSTAEWLQFLGPRHVGGGPAVYSRDGQLLTELSSDTVNSETYTVDPVSGELVRWDWQESGVVEMNCFLCHMDGPNNVARTTTLRSGAFKWANTATLSGTGIVDAVGGNFVWNQEAFDENGLLLPEYVNIQDPGNENCGQCHGLVHVDAQTPLFLAGCTPDQWSTVTTGQIFSPQKVSNSGINFVNKEEISRPYDTHAERVVGCTDCHYSLNNPIYYQELSDAKPDHLTFDPRRMDFGEYLYRPLHEFAKGQSAQSSVAPELDNTLRRCESCHSAETTHDWLPYTDKHMEALSCETCHIPQMLGPAREYMDWTVVNTAGEPASMCRGIADMGETLGAALLTGYQPALLPRENSDGTVSLAPHNLITVWFWIYGDPERPVPLRDLQAAYLDGDAYHADVLAAFDVDGDGAIDDTELVIDTDEKEAVMIERLEAQGLDNPRISGEVRPYSINHNVASGEWAIKECDTCHSENSRISAVLPLADRMPGGVIPTLVDNPSTGFGGEVTVSENGRLFYQPAHQSENVNLYILGHDSVNWIDTLGMLLFIFTLIGVAGHAGLRYFMARRRVASHPQLREQYMYTVYERLWHWLQTVVIIGLILTGLVIHRPDQFSLFNFSIIVQIHNVLAFILVVNAALAAFYHLASGEIRQFLPQPRGFFNGMIEQAKYYLNGIFKGEEHPFEKTQQRKMNPIQQVTYFMILNVLLPLQVITGALMWGAQQWPDLAASLGGLPFLAPFHTLLAWLFATFIVVHVYMTTTGHTPLANIKAMMMGWDEVEVHQSAPTTTPQEGIVS